MSLAAERDSFGTMVWGAGAEASAAVCSELRAATWAYLERESDVWIEEGRDTTPWMMVGLEEDVSVKLDNVSVVVVIEDVQGWCVTSKQGLRSQPAGFCWRTCNQSHV